MTHVTDEPRTLAAGWRFALAALAATLLIVAHGCHGGDEDHELAPAAPPSRETSMAR